MRIELVIWDDAHGSNAAGEDKEPLAGYETHSVGWVIAEDSKYLRIAMDTWPKSPGDHHTATTIPKAIILKRIVLQQPTKKARKKKC